MSITPLQFATYKGLSGKWGAIQFNVQRPHYYVKTNPTLKNFEGRFIPSAWLKNNPVLTEADLISREGCLFMEITSTIPDRKNEYDWDKKVKMALSIVDLGKILMVLEGQNPDVSIMHDPGAKSDTQGQITKNLNVASPKGIKEGAMVRVTQKNVDGTTITHSVPLSGDEVKVLSCLIRGFIPAALAWI